MLELILLIEKMRTAQIRDQKFHNSITALTRLKYEIEVDKVIDRFKSTIDWNVEDKSTIVRPADN